MLGYVYDGEIELAWTNIEQQIQKQALTLKLKEPKRLVQSMIYPGYPVNETNHDLGKRSFTVFHLLLDV